MCVTAVIVPDYFIGSHLSSSLTVQTLRLFYKLSADETAQAPTVWPARCKYDGFHSSVMK